MKGIMKVVGILVSAAMLLAMMSCGEDTEGTNPDRDDSPAVSDVSDHSDPSDASSEIDPNAPLSAEEIGKIEEELNKLEETETGEISAEVKITMDMVGTSVTSSAHMHTVSKGREQYIEGVTNSMGIETKEITYYSNGRLYTIVEMMGESYGYYEELTYEEAFDDDDSVNLFSTSSAFLADASVERNADGSMTISYNGDNEEFTQSVRGMISGLGIDDEESGVQNDIKSASMILTVDSDMTITAIKYSFEFEASYSEDGIEMAISYQIDMDTVIAAYGDDADITVPVPENLDSYEKVDMGEGV